MIGSRSASVKIFAHKEGQGFIDYPNPAGTLDGSWGVSSVNCRRLLGLGSSSFDYTFTYAKGGSTWAPWVK